MRDVDVLLAIGLSFLSAALSLIVAEIAKAVRRVRLIAGAGLTVTAIIVLIAYLVARGPSETTIRTYLAFPIPGERFGVTTTFPDIFTQYEVPLPPDTLNVSTTQRGRCTTRSAVVPGRSDAWGCMTNDPARTFDPCFRNVFREDQLLCVGSPWAKSGTAIDLEEPLPGAGGDSGIAQRDTPWAVETGEGVRCVRRAGVPVAIGNLSFIYSCSTGNSLSPEGLLSGDIDQRSSLWTTFLAEGAARDIRKVNIVVAWY